MNLDDVASTTCFVHQNLISLKRIKKKLKSKEKCDQNAKKLQIKCTAGKKGLYFDSFCFY